MEKEDIDDLDSQEYLDSLKKLQENDTERLSQVTRRLGMKSIQKLEEKD